METLDEKEIIKRKLIARLLQASVDVARHNRMGPADYIKLSEHNAAMLGEELVGIKIYTDSALSEDGFIVGRSSDSFEINS